jgi:hypothetical protein
MVHSSVYGSVCEGRRSCEEEEVQRAVQGFVVEAAGRLGPAAKKFIEAECEMSSSEESSGEQDSEGDRRSKSGTSRHTYILAFWFKS